MEEERRWNLIHLVDTFGTKNSDLKELKAECDAKNKEIKSIMAEEKLDFFQTGQFSASYVVKQTTKVNEEKLLYLLQQLDGDNFRKLGIIKTKEYIDSDALESAIYNQLIGTDMMVKIQECSTIVETPTLTVKPKKKGK